MGDRFFTNSMPDFVPEAETEAAAESIEDSFLKDLSMPYPIIADRLKQAALEIKETLVSETMQLIESPMHDYTLYSGALGTAFLLLKAHEITSDPKDLKLCLRIINACDQASVNSKVLSFLCGRSGVCAVGAVAAKRAGDDVLFSYHISEIKEILVHRDLSDELLYGKAGLLWACLFLNKHIGDNTIPENYLMSVKNELIGQGRDQAKGGATSPLAYEWYRKKNWGAAHGLGGILHALMDSELKPREKRLVKRSIKYIIENRLPSGNYPSSEEDKNEDIRVQWCHGAPGIALMLVKASRVYEEEEFEQAAVDAAEVVWRRGLLKRVGICHGISGNAYVFLSLYQLTGRVEYLYKAKAFACFLLNKAQSLIADGVMHAGDRRLSLFEGIGGMAYLFLDMINPSMAKFPGFDI